MEKLHRDGSFSSSCTDVLVNRLFRIIVRKFQVRDVYLSLPGVPSEELMAMGLPPDPRKEILIGALSIMQSFSRVIVVENAADDLLLSHQTWSLAEDIKLGFFAVASVMMGDIKVGSLCIVDTKAHHNFSLDCQGLLMEFADTIADIWTDRQQLYQQIQRDALHMQTTVLGILQPPLRLIMQEGDRAQHCISLLKQYWRTKTFNLLDKTAAKMRRDVNFFEYMVSTAIQVVSSAQIHDGNQLKHSTDLVEDLGDIFGYSFDYEGWRGTVRELIYHYGLLSVWVYSDDKEEFMPCFLAADPCLLRFCIAAVLEHLYCSNCQQNIHITTSFSASSSTVPVSSASTVMDETLATFGGSENVHSAGDQGENDSLPSMHQRSVVHHSNRRKLCIQISSQDCLPPFPKEMAESLNMLCEHYLHGQLRQVTDHCFQFLVPVELDTTDLPMGFALSTDDATVVEHHHHHLHESDNGEPLYNHEALNLTQYQELQQQQEQHRKLLLQRQKRELFPDMVAAHALPLKTSVAPNATASLIAEAEVTGATALIDSDGQYVPVPDVRKPLHIDTTSTRASFVFPSGFSGILALPSCSNIAQTIVDTCRSFIIMKSPSLTALTPHNKVAPSLPITACCTPLASAEPPVIFRDENTSMFGFPTLWHSKVTPEDPAFHQFQGVAVR